jgi:hypothetical protein
LVEKNSDGIAATFSPVFYATRYRYTFELRQFIFWVSIIELHRYNCLSQPASAHNPDIILLCELFILRPAGHNTIVGE